MKTRKIKKEVNEKPGVYKRKNAKIKSGNHLDSKSDVKESGLMYVTDRKKITKNEISLTNQLNAELEDFVKSSKDFDWPAKTAITFSDFFSNKLLVVMAIRTGIPYSLFELIQNITPFTSNDWANILGISGKSLMRYQQQDKPFKSIHTEKIIELFEVTNLGLEVFGDNEKFRRWLETPNYALGSLKPFDLLRDSYGKEMIIAELTRIDHGILA